MFSKKEFTPLVFIFKKEKRIPLHMFLVFFPIDVLFLDNEKKVVEVKENFRPFTFYNPKNKAQFVIEMQYGTIKNNVDIGDKIEF